jgi:N-acetylglucosamine malate deacetylase 1
MKLDILAFGVHPDDVELGCAGTMIKMADAGYSTGIIDLTAGELGTRGDSVTRLKEANEAARLMKVKVRENIGMKDGFFELTEENKLLVVKMIRRYRPDIVLCNAVHDRHPDHGRAARLISEACFLSGLIKVVTDDNGLQTQPWRPRAVYHYIQDRYLKPDFIVDITGFMDLKMQAVMAFASQFYNPDSSEPDTPISSRHFLDFLKARSVEYGRLIGAEYGEGFVVERPVGVDDLMVLK